MQEQQPEEDKALDSTSALEKAIRLDKKHTNFDFHDPLRGYQPNDHIDSHSRSPTLNFNLRDPLLRLFLNPSGDTSAITTSKQSTTTN